MNSNFLLKLISICWIISFVVCVLYMFHITPVRYNFIITYGLVAGIFILYPLVLFTVWKETGYELSMMKYLRKNLAYKESPKWLKYFLKCTGIFMLYVFLFHPKDYGDIEANKLLPLLAIFVFFTLDFGQWYM